MVRAATLDDAAAIAHVNVSSWRSSFIGMLPDEFLASLSEANYTERWKRVIVEGSSKVYLAEDETGVVGFASGGRERAGEQGYKGELYAIYVVDAAKRRGFGRELVRAMVGGLRELALGDMIVWVLRDNSPARAFYERLGGVYVRSQPTTIGRATVEEVSYGWRRLDDVRY
jgi:GNAT superfamily N-acetyltransferase